MYKTHHVNVFPPPSPPPFIITNHTVTLVRRLRPHGRGWAVLQAVGQPSINGTSLVGCERAEPPLRTLRGGEVAGIRTREDPKRAVGQAGWRKRLHFTRTRTRTRTRAKMSVSQVRIVKGVVRARAAWY